MGCNPNLGLFIFILLFILYNHWELRDTTPPLFFFNTSLFWHGKVLQDHLVFFPRINHFPKELWLFLHWKTGFRNQDLGLRCAHCHWDVTVSWLSKWTELENACVLQYLSILIVKENMSSYWCLGFQSSTTGLIPIFLLCAINFFSSIDKLNYHYVSIVYLFICSSLEYT
jgi:hypothetical protein